MGDSPTASLVGSLAGAWIDPVMDSPIDLLIDAVATLARRLIGPLFDVFTGRAIDAWLDSYIGSLIYRLIHLSPRRFLRCAVNW